MSPWLLQAALDVQVLKSVVVPLEEVNKEVLLCGTEIFNSSLFLLPISSLLCNLIWDDFCM